MDSIPLPHELRHVQPLVESYVRARLHEFGVMVARLSNPSLSIEQVHRVLQDAFNRLRPPDPYLPPPVVVPPHLRLVLRHDCLSTGCGESGCILCQYNPSRICRRNLKQKYLIDDHLRAKCGASLRVEIVDESSHCYEDPLPDIQLEVHVLNGEKYKEMCPDNMLLPPQQLSQCIVQPNQKKPLLKREGVMGVSLDDHRILLQPENGQSSLSDLQCTTSSEALLLGKAPTFRLLVWAVDRGGMPLMSITYVVSESFVVATKRVKGAIKSDIPSVAEPISKLVHIGKATVDKLVDLRGAAKEEDIEIDIPNDLNKIEKVGQFQRLVELTELNSDLKNKVRHLLKLSPEKWEEVSQNALAAVVPDFRPRVWWCQSLGVGLLFACKNGAVATEHAIAFIKKGQGGADDEVIPTAQLTPSLYQLLPKLKQQALASWYAPGHPGWAIYWKDSNDPMAMAMQQQNTLGPGTGLPMPSPGPSGEAKTPGLATPPSPALSNTAVSPSLSMSPPLPPNSLPQMHEMTKHEHDQVPDGRYPQGPGEPSYSPSTRSPGVRKHMTPFARPHLQSELTTQFPTWVASAGPQADPQDPLPLHPSPYDTLTNHALPDHAQFGSYLPSWVPPGVAMDSSFEFPGGGELNGLLNQGGLSDPSLFDPTSQPLGLNSQLGADGQANSLTAMFDLPSVSLYTVGGGVDGGDEVHDMDRALSLKLDMSLDLQEGGRE